VKINHHGKAKILSQQEIHELFTRGLQSDRDRALFGVCLFSACRIREACTLRLEDIYDNAGRLRPKLMLRKSNTKGKLASRTIPIIQDLRVLLLRYKPKPNQPYLFPGRFAGTHLNPDTGDRILRQACKRIGLQGVSSHSFRRTALTIMSDSGIPLRVVQEISGHRNLSQLQEYLEVKDSQVLGAVNTLSLVSPVGDEIGKYNFSAMDSSDLPSSVEFPNQ
jgi:integrase/recombinase XerD